MSLGIHILDATAAGLGPGDGLVEQVAEGFRVPVVRRAQRLDVRSAFDASRGQHDATALLHQVVALSADPAEKRVAIVDVDLFIPVLTYVFGQAQLGGVAALVSSHRLAAPFYGLPPDPELFRERVAKEVVHELGHVFGLYHCRQFECVMRSSTYVEEIDLKRVSFCAECEARLRAAVGTP